MIPARVSFPLAACTLGLLVAASGCGGRDRLEIVVGEVVFPDGRAVAGGVVEFDPDGPGGRPARAAIGSDGRFALRSGAAAGAKAGQYRVAVVQLDGDPAITAHHHHRPRVHPKFGRFETSGLVEEIVAGGRNAPRIVVEPLLTTSTSPRNAQPVPSGN